MAEENIKNRLITNQKGQSLVEYMLLLAIIVGISFAFMAGINGGIATRWEALAAVLINIDTDTQTVYTIP